MGNEVAGPSRALSLSLPPSEADRPGDDYPAGCLGPFPPPGSELMGWAVVLASVLCAFTCCFVVFFFFNQNIY